MVESSDVLGSSVGGKFFAINRAMHRDVTALGLLVPE